MPAFQNETATRRARARRLLLLLPSLALCGAGLVRAAQGQAEPDPETAFRTTMQPLLQKHCFGCHGEKAPRGGINLAKFKDLPSIQKDQATWRHALTLIRERNMPPRGAPQPTPEQRDQLAAWLKHALDSVDESLIPRNPGRVLIHRLSRTEYNNTVRDLFGVTSRPADKFPADGGGGGGFDNNADTLFIPPILMERYLEAAGTVLDEAPGERVFTARPGKTLKPRDAAKKVIGDHAVRAYRRPLALEELAVLMRLYDGAAARKEPWESAVKLALKAVLVSPSFLFRVEQDQPTTDAYPINEFELASRLSYFLWSSMPDEELFALAKAGKLRDPKTLDAQVARMLKDPKSEALAESFTGQWLRVRDLFTAAQPDPRRYPTFKTALRDAMYREPVEFFGSLLKDDTSLLRLLDADYTYLNEDLAKHYGVEGVQGPQFRKVKLGDRNRGGILTMASVLTVTSYPQRTSPVLRGKWVLEEVLGAEVPPPPPDAGGLPADDAPKEGLTFRQRLEKHREKPECSSCHSRMDPIGFGLENFDAIGRWRTTIGKEPVDAAAEMPTGEKFAGPVELKGVVMRRKEEFLRNLTEKMLAYALGRGLEPYDIPTVRQITTAVAKDDYRSSTLVREIVKSYPFTYRKND